MPKLKRPGDASSRSWDPVADWYAGWVGAQGSRHHRNVAIPAVIDLLGPVPGESVLDIGCGSGVLAPHVAQAGARYTGIDAGGRLIAVARRQHGPHGRFVKGDATRLDLLDELGRGSFDAAVFLLSIQDIDPLPRAVDFAAGSLKAGGRLVVLMTHPCFRVPRQSGWGWDPQRKLRFRRVDRYLTSLVVPMKRYGKDGRGATRSYHRPLEQYVAAIAQSGLLIERVREIPYHDHGRSGTGSGPERLANLEIPLFLGIRAVKR